MSPALRRLASTSALAIALAAGAPPAAAQQPAKQAPPAPGPARDFTLPVPVRHTLPNGLQVTLVQYGTVPKAAVQLAISAGNVDEGPAEVWLADLTGQLLLEGTTTRSAADLSLAAARMGGSLNVTVGVDRTRLGGEVLSEFAPEMVRLLGEVVQQPAFNPKEVERLKDDLARDLSLQKSSPQALADEAFRAALYGNHPYGRTFPADAVLAAYTADQARRFHATHFGAARATLYIVGRFDEAAALAAAREAFGGWTRGTPPSRLAPAPSSTRAIHLVDRPGAVQSTIILGLPVANPTNPDYVALRVTDTLLGGYFSSRITSNIREDKGYTYSPGSTVSARARDAYWAQQADVTTAVTGASLQEIFKEIDRLQAEPPPAAELDAVKNYMAGFFVLNNSSRLGIIGQLEFLAVQGLPDDYITGYVRRVRAVTPAEVQRIARQYLDDGRMAIAIVGDRKAIEEQIKPFGLIR